MKTVMPVYDMHSQNDKMLDQVLMVRGIKCSNHDIASNG